MLWIISHGHSCTAGWPRTQIITIYKVRGHVLFPLAFLFTLEFLFILLSKLAFVLLSLLFFSCLRAWICLFCRARVRARVRILVRALSVFVLVCVHVFVSPIVSLYLLVLKLVRIVVLVFNLVLLSVLVFVLVLTPAFWRMFAVQFLSALFFVFLVFIVFVVCVFLTMLVFTFISVDDWLINHSCIYLSLKNVFRCYSSPFVRSHVWVGGKHFEWLRTI